MSKNRDRRSRPRFKREDLMNANNAVDAATTDNATWGFKPCPNKHMGLNARIFEKRPADKSAEPAE